MVTEEGLVTLREVIEYQVLVNSCEKVRKDLVEKANLYVALSYFRVGKFINEAMLDGRILNKYGNSVMTQLSTDIHVNLSDLYRSCKLADRFPTEEEFLGWWDRQERQKLHPSWTWIKGHLLPDPSSDVQDISSLEAHAEDVMRQVEKMADKVEELNTLLQNPQISDDVKQQIYGVYTQAQSIISESIVAASDTSEVDIIRNPAYLHYVKSLPCCYCGRPGDDPHHIETGGVGHKCSDYATVPLCREHHNAIQNNEHKINLEYKGFDIWRECSTTLMKWFIGGNNEG